LWEGGGLEFFLRMKTSACSFPPLSGGAFFKISTAQRLNPKPQTLNPKP